MRDLNKNLEITIQNTKDELHSFPIDQSIFLGFSERVEDSLLESHIFIVQGLDSRDLLHIGDNYNQNIGIVKETFREIPVSIEVETETPFIVKVTPKAPLTPGYSYTVLVKDSLPTEYISADKVVSYCDSYINVLRGDLEGEFLLTVLEDSKLTPNSSLVTISIEGMTKTLDLYKNKNIVLDTLKLELEFPSKIYLEGESFNIIVLGKTDYTSSTTFPFKTSPTKHIKPINSNNKKISEKDIVDFNNSLNKNLVQSKDTTCTITTTGYNTFNITLSNPVSDKVDIDNISFTTTEAFGMYTLESLGLYSRDKIYKLTVDIVDEYTLGVTVDYED